MKPWLWIVLLFLGTAQAATESRFEFSDPQQAQLFKELSQELRCPKCQNQNIADSDAVVARDLRAKVFELLQQGQSKQQVVDFMIDRYGYFVHYKPPVTAGTLILWLLPALFMLLGALVVWLRQRRQRRLQQRSWSAQDDAQLQALIRQVEQE